MPPLVLLLCLMFYMIALRLLYGKVLVKKIGKLVEVFLLKRHHAFEHRQRSVTAHLLHYVMCHLRYALFGYLSEISGKHRCDKRVDDGLDEWLKIFLYGITAADDA